MRIQNTLSSFSMAVLQEEVKSMDWDDWPDDIAQAIYNTWIYQGEEDKGAIDLDLDPLLWVKIRLFT